MVACGPPGLNGDTNILYHNNGDGTFTDVSAKAGILKANGTFGLGVLTADFDNDGWPDIYVADDSTASALYKNLHDGRFVDVGMEAGCVLSADGKPQAGMGVSAADYDLDGNLDIVKTNFAGDTPSLYHNRGNWNFEDATFQAGLGAHTQYLGWGCGFFDYDNDGWPDILLCNGHVYPEVEQLKTEAGYPQRKILYKNLRNGRFEEVSQYAGPGINVPMPRGARLSATSTTTATSTSWSTPSTATRNFCAATPNWTTTGSRSSASAPSRTAAASARASSASAILPTSTKPHPQIDEVRSGGSYISQNDLRIHFGLGKADKADLIEIRWPSGQVDTLKDVKANQLIVVKEGQGIVKTQTFDTKTVPKSK